MFEGVSSHQWRAESSNRWRWSWGGPVSRRTHSSIRSSCSRRSFGQCSPPARCSLSPIEFSRSPARWWTCWSQTCSRRSRKPCSLFDSSRPDRSELSSWRRSTNPVSANQAYVNSNVISSIPRRRRISRWRRNWLCRWIRPASPLRSSSCPCRPSPRPLGHPRPPPRISGMSKRTNLRLKIPKSLPAISRVAWIKVWKFRINLLLSIDNRLNYYKFSPRRDFIPVSISAQSLDWS